MANPIKGEVQFTADGKQYTFRLGINAQVIIENRVGMTVQKFMRDKGDDFGASDIRLLFYAGLLHHHKDITEERAGDIIDEIGPAKAAAIFVEAAGLAAAPAIDDVRPQRSAKELIGMNS
jgi:hypothetical protein